MLDTQSKWATPSQQGSANNLFVYIRVRNDKVREYSLGLLISCRPYVCKWFQRFEKSTASCYKKMRGKGNLSKDIDHSSNSKLGVESCSWDCLGIAFLFSIIGCGKYVYASPHHPSQSDDLVTHAFPHLWSFTCRVTFVSSHRFFFFFFLS